MSRSVTTGITRPVRRLRSALALTLLVPMHASAQTFAASDYATLAAAISNANASGGTVVLTANITLTADLPAVGSANIPVTIEGNGFTLSGNNQFRGLVLSQGGAGAPTSTTIQNLTVRDTVATGGAGANGSAGGGGGAGLGGALYVGDLATVTVSNVTLISNSAIGGAGGISDASVNGGNGGSPSPALVGSGGNGGFGGTTPTPGQAGGLGTGGGGGGSGLGFGGASGGVGGGGGGGGGSTDATTAAGGVGGGTGADSSTGNGGGGGGLGGAVFVQAGGALVVSGGFSVNGSSVAGGAAGAGATAGRGLGAGFFLDGNGALTVATDSTAAILDVIADGAGSGGAGSWELFKTGTGTLTLGGANTYTGGTNIQSGAVSVVAAANLGIGPVTVSDGATLAITGSDTFTHAVDISGAMTAGATVNVAAGRTATWSGLWSSVETPGFLNMTGGGTLALTNGSNRYAGGTIVTGGSTLAVTTDGALGNPVGNLTLGDTSTGGALGINATGFTSSRLFTLGAGGGTIDVTGDATLSGDVTGTGGLTKIGTGMLTLGGTNTYAGGTAVNAGVLRAGNSLVFGQGPLAVATGATVDLNGFSQSFSSIGGSGTIALGGGALLTVGSDNSNSAFAGTLSGTGGLSKSGTGTLALSGANTFSGGLALQAGTLRVWSDASLGAGSVGMSNATALDLAGGVYAHTLGLAGTSSLTAGAGQSVTWSGLIGDNGSPGALRLAGGGTFALTNTGNSYSGGTVVTGGSTLNVGADAALGAAGGGLALDNATLTTTGSGTYARPLALAGTASFTVGAGQAMTWSGRIGDFGSAGTLSLAGGGTLALTNGGNSYSGGTVVTGGSTLNVGADGALGAAGSSLTLGDATSTATLGIDAPGSFLFSHPVTLGALGATIDTAGATTATFAGAVGGTGGLTKSGSGTLTLSGPVTYAGATTILGGELTTGDRDVFTRGALTIASGAMLDLKGFNQTIESLSGAGTLLLGGGASLALGGNNSSMLFAGNIGGTGSLTKNGTGTLTLAGASSYAGGTFLNGGLIVGNTTSLQGSILDNQTLIFDQATDGTFRGFITGSGGLTKIGLGTLTLHGLHGYTGLTQVQQGGLAIDAGLPGSIIVSPGATLSAAGVVGGSIDVGGTLIVPSQNNQAATFNRAFFGATSRTGALTANQLPSLLINGNLTTESGSTFSFTLSPATTAPVIVDGVANLINTHVVVGVDDPNPKRVKTYLGITANGGLHITGGDATGTSPLLVPVLTSYPTAATVTVVNLGVPLTSLVLRGNAAVVGGALDAGKAGLSGDWARVLTEVTALDDASLEAALTSLAGEIHASKVRMLALDSLAMSDLVRSELTEQEHDAEERRATGVATLRPWFAIGGERTSFKSGEFSGGSAATNGGGGGLDFKPASPWTLGGGGSLSLGDLSLSDVTATSQMTAPRAFFYSGLVFGPFAVHWGGSRAWTKSTTTRQIEFIAYIPDLNGRPVPLFPGTPPAGASSSPDRVGTTIESALPRPGVDRTAIAEEQSTSTDAWSEWQYTRKSETWTVDTKLGVRIARFARTGFGETGADSISLSGPNQTLSSSQSNFDFHAFRRKGTWRPNVLVTYRREFGDPFMTANMNFAGNPDTQFSVRGFPVPRNTFQGLFGITMRSMAGLLYTLEYQTLQSSEESRHSLRFKVRLW